MYLYKVAKHVRLEILSEKLCDESFYALVHISFFIAWPLNADLAPEGWSYLHLKYPCVYLCETALSLSTFIVQIGFQCPLQPIKVMAYVVVL
jgi:hypothetical protein